MAESSTTGNYGGSHGSLYDALCLDSSASMDSVRRNYLEAVLFLHPDKRKRVAVVNTLSSSSSSSSSISQPEFSFFFQNTIETEETFCNCGNLAESSGIRVLEESLEKSLGEERMAGTRCPVSCKSSATYSAKKIVMCSVNDSFKNFVKSPVKISAEDSIKGSVEGSVEDSVEYSINDSVKDYVKDTIKDSVKISVEDSIKGLVEDSVTDSVKDSVNERFHRVQEAWTILRDPISRALYDRQLAASREKNILARNDENIPISEEIWLYEMEWEREGEGQRESYLYPCRCGDFFEVLKEDLEEVSYFTQKMEKRKDFEFPKNSSNFGFWESICSSNLNSIIVPCGSCSLNIRILILSEGD